MYLSHDPPKPQWRGCLGNRALRGTGQEVPQHLRRPRLLPYSPSPAACLVPSGELVLSSFSPSPSLSPQPSPFLSFQELFEPFDSLVVPNEELKAAVIADDIGAGLRGHPNIQGFLAQGARKGLILEFRWQHHTHPIDERKTLT